MVRFPQLTDLRHTAAAQVRSVLRLHHESEFRALKSLRATDRPVLIDVGANRGQSIASMLLYHKDADIVAFEPNCKLVPRLRHKFRRHNNVRIRSSALESSSGWADLHIPFYGNCMLDGLASLGRNRARTWLAKHPLIGYAPESLKLKSTQVELQKLDHYQYRPTFIKIDVEGSELEVVRGAEQTLRTCKPMLMVESAHPKGPVSELLHAWGYKTLKDRHHESSTTKTPPLNRVFVARENPQDSF